MTPSGDPIRILAVDDDEIMLGILAVALGRAGYDVLTTCRPSKAVAVVEAFAPALVLLDVSMPELSGWEVLSRIRAVSDVLVMFVSGCADESDRARGLDLGADDYLVKPFSMIELLARVNALLRRARCPEALHAA